MKIKSNKKPLLIIGSGGHFKSCLDVIEESKIFYVYGLISKIDKIGSKICGYKVLSQSDNYKKFYKLGIRNAFIAVGQIKNSDKRKKIFYNLKKSNFDLPSFVSKTSKLSKNVKIGEGSIIHKICHIGRDVQIGKCNIINTASIIEHDCRIGDFCHISTSTTINGSSIIGDESFIGSGSVLSNDIKLKKKSFVKMMSRVVK
jgi:sugar O-acyltransferase (sialic acid O-acetyltransferase NeuD family)